LETIPVRPGFYRQNPKAQVVRPCINIDAEAACQGTVELVVKQTISLETTIDSFDEAAKQAVTQELATLYKVPIENVELAVSAGSVELEFTVKPNAIQASPPAPPGVAAPPTRNMRETGEFLSETEKAINAVDAGQITATISAAMGASNLGLVVAPAKQVNATPQCEALPDIAVAH
jgi:hypothetical protein